MLRRVLAIAVLFSSIAIMAQPPIGKRAVPSEIANKEPMIRRLTPKLISADTCIVRTDTGAVWQYGNWLYGDELYENFIDPEADGSCPSPYPFQISEVTIELVYLQAHTDTMQVNILDVDWTDPNCPFPGTLLAISDGYEIPIPQAGLWAIPIELNTPVTVDGPFFAGLYFADVLDSLTRATIGPWLVTDGDTANPSPPCVSYNLYDTTLGWVDLNTVGFAGYLTLYASGIPGGSGGNPIPQAELLAPSPPFLYEPVTLWARDSANSDSIETVEFSYAKSSDGIFSTITTLTMADMSVRDGLGPSSSGHGFSFEWDPTVLPEDNYWVRVTMTDKQLRSTADTIFVRIMPTAPTAEITSPANATDFCATLSMLMASSSPTMTGMNVFAKEAMLSYSLGMTPLNQSAAGDNNGNNNDGNYAIHGEFGDYYSGPAAAATALKIWADRGLVQLMQDGGSPLTMAEVAELLAEKFGTRTLMGTADEAMFAGIRDYAAERSVQLGMTAVHDPSYFDIRNHVEAKGRVAVIGVGGSTSAWLAIDGFEQWEQPDGSYYVRCADPLSGTVRNIPVRNTAGGSEIQLFSSWQTIDIMISTSSNVWPITKTLIGYDSVNADGWQFTWTPATDSLNAGSPYFVSVEGSSPNVYGNKTALYRYSCSTVFIKGDYNGDGSSDINDFYVLQNYVATRTAPPIGDAFRADANGDNNINLADLVYYMRYLFGGNPEPAY